MNQIHTSYLPLVLVLVFLCAVLCSAQHEPLSMDMQNAVPVTSESLSAEWRMEAIAHIASLVIKQTYCKLEPERPCELPEGTDLGPLKEWASQDPSWRRLTSSVSLYELARRFWQQQDYERALVAIEQALALKLFPSHEPQMLQGWQQTLVSAAPTLKRVKLETADALTLRANCMYELGKRDGSLQHLHGALESIHLASAMMHCSRDMLPEVLNHLGALAQDVSQATAAILHQTGTIPVLQHHMARYGITCTSDCSTEDGLLWEIIRYYALPLRLSSTRGKGGSLVLEVLPQPFLHAAYARQPHETKHTFAQRLFAQLTTMVYRGFMGDIQLNLPCASKDANTGQCVSYLPPWVTSGSNKGPHVDIASGAGMPPSSVGVHVRARPPTKRERDSPARRDRNTARGRSRGLPAPAPTWGLSNGVGDALSGGGAATGGPACGAGGGESKVDRGVQQQDSSPTGAQGSSDSWSECSGGLEGLEGWGACSHGEKGAGREAHPLTDLHRPSRTAPALQANLDAAMVELVSARTDVDDLLSDLIPLGVAADVAQLQATLEFLAEAMSGMSKGAFVGHGAPPSVDCPDTIPSDIQFFPIAALQACMHAPEPPDWWAEVLQRFNILDAAEFFNQQGVSRGTGEFFSSKQGANGGLSSVLKSPVGAGHPGGRSLPNFLSALPEHSLWLQQHNLHGGADAAGAHAAPLPWNAEPGGGAPPHRGVVDPMAGYARHNSWNDPRSLSDRQLLERLNRLTLDGQDVHDNPTVIITLSGLTLAVILMLAFTKHRRRVTRYLSSAHANFMAFSLPVPSMWGLLPGRGGQAVLQASREQGGLSSFGLNNHPGGSVSTQQKRAATLALREAMGSGGALKLEGAVAAGEAASVAPSLIARARQLLVQRKRQEQGSGGGGVRGSGGLTGGVASHEGERPQRSQQAKQDEKQEVSAKKGGGSLRWSLSNSVGTGATLHSLQARGLNQSISNCGSSSSVHSHSSVSSSSSSEGCGCSWLTVLMECLRVPHFLLVALGDNDLEPLQLCKGRLTSHQHTSDPREQPLLLQQPQSSHMSPSKAAIHSSSHNKHPQHSHSKQAQQGPHDSPEAAGGADAVPHPATQPPSGLQPPQHQQSSHPQQRKLDALSSEVDMPTAGDHASHRARGNSTQQQQPPQQPPQHMEQLQQAAHAASLAFEQEEYSQNEGRGARSAQDQARSMDISCDSSSKSMSKANSFSRIPSSKLSAAPSSVFHPYGGAHDKSEPGSSHSLHHQYSYPLDEPTSPLSQTHKDADVGEGWQQQTGKQRRSKLPPVRTTPQPPPPPPPPREGQPGWSHTSRVPASAPSSTGGGVNHSAFNSSRGYRTPSVASSTNGSTQSSQAPVVPPPSSSSCHPHATAHITALTATTVSAAEYASMLAAQGPWESRPRVRSGSSCSKEGGGPLSADPPPPPRPRPGPSTAGNHIHTSKGANNELQQPPPPPPPPPHGSKATPPPPPPPPLPPAKHSTPSGGWLDWLSATVKSSAPVSHSCATATLAPPPKPEGRASHSPYAIAATAPSSPAYLPNSASCRPEGSNGAAVGVAAQQPSSSHARPRQPADGAHTAYSHNNSSAKPHADALHTSSGHGWAIGTPQLQPPPSISQPPSPPGPHACKLPNGPLAANNSHAQPEDTSAGDNCHPYGSVAQAGVPNNKSSGGRGAGKGARGGRSGGGLMGGLTSRNSCMPASQQQGTAAKAIGGQAETQGSSRGMGNGNASSHGDNSTDRLPQSSPRSGGLMHALSTFMGYSNGSSHQTDIQLPPPPPPRNPQSQLASPRAVKTAHNGCSLPSGWSVCNGHGEEGDYVDPVDALPTSLLDVPTPPPTPPTSRALNPSARCFETPMFSTHTSSRPPVPPPLEHQQLTAALRPPPGFTQPHHPDPALHSYQQQATAQHAQRGSQGMAHTHQEDEHTPPPFLQSEGSGLSGFDAAPGAPVGGFVRPSLSIDPPAANLSSLMGYESQPHLFLPVTAAITTSATSANAGDGGASFGAGGLSLPPAPPPASAALSGFNIFAGSSVWSPSVALNGGGASDGGWSSMGDLLGPTGSTRVSLGDFAAPHSLKTALHVQPEGGAPGSVLHQNPSWGHADAGGSSEGAASSAVPVSAALGTAWGSGGTNMVGEWSAGGGASDWTLGKGLSGLTLSAFTAQVMELGQGGTQQGLHPHQHTQHQQCVEQQQGRTGEDRQGWDGAEGAQDALDMQELNAYEGIIRNIVD